VFDLDDLAEQLRQMQKLGGMAGVLGMLPGVGKIKKQLDTAQLDKSVFERQLAIISSLTRFERQNPKVMNASRKKRAAAGSGSRVEDVNRLLKMHLQMSDMMKKMGRNPGMLGRMFGGGGMPDAAEMERMQAELQSIDPNALPSDVRELMKQLPEPGPLASPATGGKLPGLPGLGGKALPGLGSNPFKGLPGLGKTKR
jgi:signal recognition particle subunit SRP54